MHLELFSAPVWINLAKITFSYLKKFKLHFRDAMPLIFTSAVKTKVANLVFVWFCFSWQLKHWKNINLTCQKTDCPVFWISRLRAFIKYLSLIELYRYYSREKPFLKRLQGISFKHTLLVCFVGFLVVFFYNYNNIWSWNLNPRTVLPTLLFSLWITKCFIFPLEDCVLHKFCL